ncbi:MAG: squalene/phytoene synthase family protein [Acetobacteraceae bacterium]|nr:squalene/phytoene synthase family protein [Acetobacteraceae bacterium]
MSTLSRVGELARQHDPDRFFTTLFAPAAARPALWALYAFNHELVRAREAVREPMMAMIRLQWWREVVEGEAKRHEIATPLHEAIAAGALKQEDLLALIEAREEDLPDTGEGWVQFADRTAGMLAVAAGHALGHSEVPGLRAAGTAYGGAGLLRNRALAGAKPLPALRAAVEAALADARAAKLPRGALPAALPAVFAARDLQRERPVRHRAFGDKLAVTLAAATGRL